MIYVTNWILTLSPDFIEAQAPVGGSWFGRWWKRGDGTTASGPVKASLGEENAFYYDKEQKRWVNRKVSSGTNYLYK